MIKDIEEVKANTTSDRNINTLDKVERALDKFSGLIESFSFTPHKEEEVKPETPEIEMPQAMKFVYVRKRGGRVVKRQVKESSE